MRGIASAMRNPAYFAGFSAPNGAKIAYSRGDSSFRGIQIKNGHLNEQAHEDVLFYLDTAHREYCYNGIFPCFFLGASTCLFLRPFNALIMASLVSSGLITSFT